MRAVPVAYWCWKKIPCDQGKVVPATLLCGVGGVLLVSNGLPFAVLEVRSVRTILANLTAPSTFSSPVPCSNMLYPGSCCVVYIRIIFTMLGVSFGLS